MKMLSITITKVIMLDFIANEGAVRCEAQYYVVYTFMRMHVKADAQKRGHYRFPMTEGVNIL